ncbi:hypothetical protein J6590_047061 [Homalodisca vitripennis]|nr:hypothetical protein J6590_047061 [Homalodisca vitripennis]
MQDGWSFQLQLWSRHFHTPPSCSDNGQPAKTMSHSLLKGSVPTVTNPSEFHEVLAPANTCSCSNASKSLVYKHSLNANKPADAVALPPTEAVLDLYISKQHNWLKVSEGAGKELVCLSVRYLKKGLTYRLQTLQDASFLHRQHQVR